MQFIYKWNRVIQNSLYDKYDQPILLIDKPIDSTRESIQNLVTLATNPNKTLKSIDDLLMKK